jgi:hypothetical protein
MRDVFGILVKLRSAAKPLPNRGPLVKSKVRNRQLPKNWHFEECSRSARTNGNLITIPDRFSVLQAREAMSDLRMPQSTTIPFTTLASISKKCLDRDTAFL